MNHFRVSRCLKFWLFFELRRKTVPSFDYFLMIMFKYDCTRYGSFLLKKCIIPKDSVHVTMSLGSIFIRVGGFSCQMCLFFVWESDNIYPQMITKPFVLKCKFLVAMTVDIVESFLVPIFLI